MAPKEVMRVTAAEDLRTTATEVELSPRLDLSRPELAPIMERYAPRGDHSGYALFRQPSALVVTRHEGQDRPIAQALEEEGWSVKTCAGPGRSLCPLTRGERCSLRETVDAAVVFVDPRERGHQLGSVPRLRCAADSASPGVVALEGRLDGARYEAGTAIIGALHGPDAVLGTITALIGAGSEAERRDDRG